MFAIIKDNTFVQFLASGTPFTLDEIQYPQNWLNLSTPEEKQALGIVDVVYAARPDDKYYWVSEDAPVVTDGVVSIAYTAQPKDLDNLKVQAIDKINDAIYSTLKTTDYIMARNLADPLYKPQWIVWRDSVVSTGKAAKDAVSACMDVESLIGLTYEFPHNPDYVAP